LNLKLRITEDPLTFTDTYEYRSRWFIAFSNYYSSARLILS
jgi:hypothetical protein